MRVSLFLNRLFKKEKTRAYWHVALERWLWWLSDHLSVPAGHQSQCWKSSLTAAPPWTCWAPVPLASAPPNSPTCKAQVTYSGTQSSRAQCPPCTWTGALQLKEVQGTKIPAEAHGEAGVEVHSTPELGAPAGVSRALGEAQGTFSSLGENQGLTPHSGLWELQAAAMFARWLLFNTHVRPQARPVSPHRAAGSGQGSSGFPSQPWDLGHAQSLASFSVLWGLRAHGTAAPTPSSPRGPSGKGTSSPQRCLRPRPPSRTSTHWTLVAASCHAHAMSPQCPEWQPLS